MGPYAASAQPSRQLIRRYTTLKCQSINIRLRNFGYEIFNIFLPHYLLLCWILPRGESRLVSHSEMKIDDSTFSTLNEEINNCESNKQHSWTTNVDVYASIRSLSYNSID